jgi:hypothetical protein
MPDIHLKCPLWVCPLAGGGLWPSPISLILGGRYSMVLCWHQDVALMPVGHVFGRDFYAVSGSLKFEHALDDRFHFPLKL